MASQTALARLGDLFLKDKATVCRLFSEWFYTYHADLFVHGVPFDVYVRKMETVRREMGPARRVIDVGAGFGVYASLLRILGVPEIVALDYHGEKASVARRLVAYLGLDGVSVLQGDATALGFPAGAFDGALALASLSHIRDAPRALAEVARVLRPGGRLYVFEDNNSTFPGYRRHMTLQWEGAESGRYAEGVPSEKQRAESYVEMRRQMIAGRFAGLSPAELDRCARATRGLYGAQIFGAVEGYRSSGRFRNPRRHLVCHPVSGEYEEYPLNPFLVNRMLRGAGFRPRLRSPHSGPYRGRFGWLKRLAAAALRLWPMSLAWLSPTFAVLATRRERTPAAEVLP